MRDLFPSARVGILRREHRAVVLPEIVHHAEETPVRREADLMARRVDLVEGHLPMILGYFHDVILVLRIRVELQESGRFEIALRVQNRDATTEAHDGCRPAPAWMPDGAAS